MAAPYLGAVVAEPSTAVPLWQCACHCRPAAGVRCLTCQAFKQILDRALVRQAAAQKGSVAWPKYK
jgi:hypothetical protein